MTNQEHTSTVRVDTPLGTVEGRWLGEVARFAGIPYAEAPVGERRFRPPTPRAPWEGVLDAGSFGPICPQNPSFMDVMFGLTPEPQDEDCLFLNVWTPDPTRRGDDALPVMFWIHGGAFEMGSGSTDIYDGATFARRGVVFVSINYRLGPLGFLELGGVDPGFAGSGNCGLLDQIEALRWVRANIESFGGDPSRITVFGESAGSMSTALLLSSPLTDGMIAGAICQSGGLNAPRELRLARDEGADVMARGGWSSVAEAQEAPVADLLLVHAALSMERWGNPDALLAGSHDPASAMAFRPVCDGEVVPLDPLGAIREGAAAGVRLLAGHNLEEWKLFSLLVPPSGSADEFDRRAKLLADDPETLVAAYRADHPDASPADLECAIVTDLVFRLPTVDLVDAQAAHAPVWQYQFDWRSPAIGAAHAVELPFVFSQLHDERLAPMFGAEPPHSLADAMSGAWAAFAIHGTPAAPADLDWPTVSGDGTRRVLHFDVTPNVDSDPLPNSLAYWRR